MFFTEKQDEEHQVHKTSGKLEHDFEKLTHQTGWIEVVTSLTEVSRCSSCILDDILFFMWFLHENSCPQLYVLSKRGDISLCLKNSRCTGRAHALIQILNCAALG